MKIFQFLCFIFGQGPAPFRIFVNIHVLLRTLATYFLNSLFQLLLSQFSGMLFDVFPDVGDISILILLLRQGLDIVTLLVFFFNLLSLLSLYKRFFRLFVVLLITYIRSWVWVSVPPRRRLSFLRLIPTFIRWDWVALISLFFVDILLSVVLIVLLQLVVSTVLLAIIIIHVVIFLVLVLVLVIWFHLVLHVLVLRVGRWYSSLLGPVISMLLILLAAVACGW